MAISHWIIGSVSHHFIWKHIQQFPRLQNRPDTVGDVIKDHPTLPAWTTDSIASSCLPLHELLGRSFLEFVSSSLLIKPCSKSVFPFFARRWIAICWKRNSYRLWRLAMLPVKVVTVKPDQKHLLFIWSLALLSLYSGDHKNSLCHILVHVNRLWSLPVYQRSHLVLYFLISALFS